MARIDARSRTFTAGEALEPHRRVLLNSSNLVMYADANERCVGVTDGRAAASGDPIAVMLVSKEGTVEVEANEAIEIADVVYGGADGKVSDTSTTAIQFGIAMSAATATGQIIEVLVDQGSTLSA
jgi:hypothetical protein